MSSRSATFLAALMSFAATASTHADSQSIAAPKVGPHAIGGTVTSAAGAEAGVWVIAESSNLPKRLLKIVVTDDHGRFVIPDVPGAKYNVWSRGYGLADSEPVEASPGNVVSLKTSKANAAEAAQIYPANHWFSLIQVPGANEFPGTGPSGNGISPAMRTQQHWIAHMVENCQFCHQLGNKATRELPDIGDPIAAWEQRIKKDRSPDDVFFEGDDSHYKRNYGARMSNLMTLFGRERGLRMFSDWTTRVAKGEIPPAPARPAGVERNIVISMRDMGGGRFLHDHSSSDKRNPAINAGGPVYGYGTFSGMIISHDPHTGVEQQFKLTDAKGNYFKNAHPHTGTMDAKGRVWVADMVQFGGATPDTTGGNPAYCIEPSNRFAKYFPREYKHARLATVFDPKTKRDTLLPVCFGTHHLNFDSNERLYFSGDTEVVGWIDVKTLDKTQKIEQAVGWCPMVLDTNGDGKITADRNEWNQRLDGIGGGEGDGLGADVAGSTAPDPEKDTRIAGFNYGMAISPRDQSYWSAKYSPLVPSGVVRVEAGSNPPLTCKTEYYEPPMPNGKAAAYNIRGVDVDATGVAWVAFGTGAIGKFDRSKCKVTNGPSALGQHCPEGWEIIETSGPKLKGTDVGSDWFYLVFIDHHDVLGLGKGVPIFPNSSGDELLAYLPKKKEFVRLRVPYPLGFYARGVDARIDDPKAGWKGRGLWATNNLTPIWHQETGEGSELSAVHFQLRPDPLAQ